MFLHKNIRLNIDAHCIASEIVMSSIKTYIILSLFSLYLMILPIIIFCNDDFISVYEINSGFVDFEILGNLNNSLCLLAFSRKSFCVILPKIILF